MPKKRRKLSPEMENEIASAKRKVELINAIINDIEEEDIQTEYKTAFSSVHITYLTLVELYKKIGFCDETSSTLDSYNSLLHDFELEYEI